MPKQRAQQIPEDVQKFLWKIVDLHLLGSRDESFAQWAATRATLLLEHYGLL